MSSLAQSLVTWEEFLRLPERPETGKRYELQDGEVVVVPPARPLHIKLQKRIERLLEAAAGEPRGGDDRSFHIARFRICNIGSRTSLIFRKPIGMRFPG